MVYLTRQFVLKIIILLSSWLSIKYMKKPLLAVGLYVTVMYMIVCIKVYMYTQLLIQFLGDRDAASATQKANADRSC